MRVLLIGGVLALGAGADASPPSYAPAPSHLHKGRLIPLAPLDHPHVWHVPLATIDPPGQVLDS